MAGESILKKVILLLVTSVFYEILQQFTSLPDVIILVISIAQVGIIMLVQHIADEVLRRKLEKQQIDFYCQNCCGKDCEKCLDELDI